MADVSGRRFVVTGTASGIGHAVAERLVTAGAEVYSLDRNTPSAAVVDHVEVDLAPSDAVMADEIFGPVLPILTVESTDAAVDFVNSRPKPLALYVFTNNRRLGRDIINRTPSGGAVINHVMMHCLVPQLPFGGVGASGMGAYHGRLGFETLSHRRAVLARRSRPDPTLIYPPHTDRARAIIRRLL